MAAEISLSCVATARVEAAVAEKVCGEFLSFLGETHPDRRFVAGGTGLPHIAVTITSANDRSLGLDVGWTAADGTASSGTPLQRAFYDRNSDIELRRRFYQTFLDTNPLPF